MAAAAVLLLLAGGAWLLLRPRTVNVVAATSRYHNDVAPGSNKAVLTLADGSTITLDSSHSGQLAQQGGVTITQQNGQLVYQPAGKDTVTLYNTMTTPRGGQFVVMLPDNSRVWLNAASSIRFPTAFTGSERLVELSGEAYFEITQQAAQPFVVKMNDTKVRVLGTQFNSMAYTGDAVSRTTLVNGLVQVETMGQKLLVHPGEQAVAGESLTLDTHPDIEEVLAWKNGRFQFGENTSITMLMRQIANWYDVEVVYHGTVKNHVGGSVPRTATLAHLLKVLEATGIVHFTLEGRRVDVYPSD
jgi:ferric-dicitrate binding protein FerR (iron transport regulator)